MSVNFDHKYDQKQKRDYCFVISKDKKQFYKYK